MMALKEVFSGKHVSVRDGKKKAAKQITIIKHKYMTTRTITNNNGTQQTSNTTPNNYNQGLEVYLNRECLSYLTHRNFYSISAKQKCYLN